MTARTRWLRLTVATAVVWALGAAAAGAAPSGGITSPAPDAVVEVPSPTVAGSFTQDGVNGKVDSVSLQVSSLKGYGSWQQAIPGRGTPTLEFSWTLPPLAYNGPYQATARASGSNWTGPTGEQQSTVTFHLAVRPAQPSGLTATPDADTGAVEVVWTKNQEADLLGYQLQRRADGARDWQELAQIPSPDTSYIDTETDLGTWAYRVVAVRAGATDDEVVTSDPSQPAEATVTPPPTTTTTTSGGAGGAGAGGSGGEGAGAEGGSGSTTATSSPTARRSSGPAVSKSSRVDLSRFSSLLDANRRAALSTKPLPPPDPGYDETLPYQQPPATEAPAPVEDPESAASFTQEIITDSSDRDRKLKFVAGALLAFVVSMHGWFLRGEVRRAEELEALPPT